MLLQFPPVGIQCAVVSRASVSHKAGFAAWRRQARVGWGCLVRGGQRRAQGRLCSMHLKLDVKVVPGVETTQQEIRTFRRWPAETGE